jgi:2-polyprenyl-6-methoxyphenol hydroxylase-like FAD-dependent oxidoreductase
MGLELTTKCCIVGCGPAGAMLGLMLARQGVDVVVLEKHGDFLRDFRGDDLTPGTVEVLDQLGLADSFLQLGPKRLHKVEAHTPDGSLPLADFRKVRTRFPFIAVVPQWDFLNFITREAARYPRFRLLMSTEAIDVLTDSGTVRGVRFRQGDDEGSVRALLTVAADGRGSVTRERAGLTVKASAPPVDLLWMKLPHRDVRPDHPAIAIYLANGWAMARIDRGSYWQTACLIPKGAADAMRAAGIDQFREIVRGTMPDLAAQLADLRDWSEVSLLNVQANRLRRWHRPGLLCIGDAAHAMSPIGGAGINVAIGDAVAAANRLAGPLLAGEVRTRDLAAIQRRRAWQVRILQALQRKLTEGYLTTASRTGMALRRHVAPILMNLPGLPRLRARVTAFGVRRERLTAPAAATP